MTLSVAATTAVGPIVVEVSATHGVHTGDLVAGSVSFAAAGVLLWLVAVATAGRPGG